MVNKEQNFVSAIIYVHNAENRIKEFLETVIAVFEKNFEHAEIICVNDASNDNSVTMIKESVTFSSTCSISVINMSYFHGLEMAMKAGIDLSIGDFVFEFDNTYLDFDSQIIMDIYQRALQGYDIVSASAKRKEKFTSKLFYKAFERYTDLSYKMSTESFRVLSRRVLNRVEAMNKTIPYRKIAYANCGLKTDNLKYDVVHQVNWTNDEKEKSYRISLAVDSLILFTEMGYSFAKMMTVLMMCMSIAMLFYSLFIYTTAHPVAGWTTTILFLSIAFFGLFGILTIVIKYLQLLIDLIFKRKQYTFESVEKLTK